ncbi:hypothetical protein [Aliiroseovarius subalbicans]|uniref:hypothetical protein n=1 Tax=Aliiroseovarius subalbicans TaxID=2925840 RepID=UPI001F5A1734|nr:hypothetical protein [Aliiroseovarius subalbicans]MCI2398643.1 hypothetical protein [Aliiroseovarius subalbicans]
MAPELVLELVEKHFISALQALQRVLDDLDAGAFDTVPEVSKKADAARKAMQSLFDERKRVDQARGTAPGNTAGRELDLVAARDEIGRRLARLRDIGGAGGVPEQPE